MVTRRRSDDGHDLVLVDDVFISPVRMLMLVLMLVANGVGGSARGEGGDSEETGLHVDVKDGWVAGWSGSV